MFCGNCGSELQQTDKFCGVCGAVNEEASSAPAPPRQPARPAPAPGPAPARPAPQGPQAAPPRPPAQAPARPAPAQPAPPAAPAQPPAAKAGRPPKQGKQPLPDLPSKIPGDKKKGGALKILLPILLVCLAAAVYFQFIMPKDEAPAPPTGPNPKMLAGKVNVKGYADTLCGLTKTNPVAIDDEYDYEFHALMSADAELLSEKGYTEEEYVEFAVNDIKDQMGQQVFEKTTVCDVVKAEKMDCSRMYADLVDALARQNITYNLATVEKAGETQKIKTCGVIVLNQGWEGTEGQFPIVYFTGAKERNLRILNYFYSDFYTQFEEAATDAVE